MKTGWPFVFRPSRGRLTPGPLQCGAAKSWSSRLPEEHLDSGADDCAVLVIDSDAHTALALLDDLRRHGFPQARQVAPGLAVPPAAAAAQPAVVLYNHHNDQPDALLSCCTAKLAAPDTLVVAIGSAGPGVKFLRSWNRDNPYLHAILEKPLRPGQLLATLRELVERRQAERSMRERAAQLDNLLPEGAVQALAHGRQDADDMFEGAVVFTDIRRSSELINSSAPRDFFRMLNASLSAQAARVRAFDGAVVKYTGDGMMALFRGPGRSHLALRCALALAEPALQQPVAFGVGVAEGLVLAGMVGDFAEAGQRRQYDVIGATVHLAARLCAQAEAGTVVATRSVVRSARLAAPAEDQGPLHVRGFAEPIACMALRPSQPQTA